MVANPVAQCRSAVLKFHFVNRLPKLDPVKVTHSACLEKSGSECRLRGLGFRVLEDNLPLGVAAPNPKINDQVMNDQNGVCSVEQWRDGSCASPPVVLDIAFSEIGECVYDCHILEHEDGGMMAKIKVVPSPQ
ncbi:multicopper oxidase domain-containing protein [Methylocystis bryophila]|uniref:Uncharacterized protein n=1 Tax=Methylocystis bryophila TaxID=655015 RepID=A0A1W6MVT9_9HYPH|nr:multicopper oxidase domain-containing protein [Methylocystis bryophila]ARN81728.1 hypothetical protein B1812_12305 [Methylocystis bryophila]